VRPFVAVLSLSATEQTQTEKEKSMESNSTSNNPANGTDSRTSDGKIPARNRSEIPQIPPISERDVRAFVRSLLRGAGGRMERDDLLPAIEKVTDWAVEVRIQQACLKSVLDGDIDVGFDSDGEMWFQRPGEKR